MSSHAAMLASMNAAWCAAEDSFGIATIPPGTARTSMVTGMVLLCN